LWKKSVLILQHKIVVRPIYVTSNNACNMIGGQVVKRHNCYVRIYVIFYKL